MKLHLNVSKKLAVGFLLLSSFAIAVSARAEEDAAAVNGTSAQIQARMKKAVQAAGFKAGELGLWVGTSNGEKMTTYFGQNAEKSFIPASLSKLVTAGAILQGLKPDHKFRTQVVSDAKMESGALAGNMYLVGGGDPSFVSQDMWALVNELSRTGVTSVEGDVIVDDSLFDSVRFGSDRQDERVDRAYDAPVGAMSMNWNSVNVYVRPGAKVGDPAKVFADVQTPYLKVRNQTKTVASGRGKTISVERTTEKGFVGDVIIVSGSMAANHPEFVVYKSISQPDLWAGNNFVEFLRQRGIAVKGKVKSGTAPKSALALAWVDSKPLSQIVADMAKWSNNYVAEMLVKNLAAGSGDTAQAGQASMEKGMENVRKYLESAGLKAGDYEFINAAGFTRKNKLSPLQMGRLLEHVRSDFTIFPEYLSALPIAGVDGTLRNRMKNGAAERWVRAKTGLLNGVVGLAGYAGRPGGEIVTFAFIYNGGGKEDSARALFDRMATQIVEN